MKQTDYPPHFKPTQNLDEIDFKQQNLSTSEIYAIPIPYCAEISYQKQEFSAALEDYVAKRKIYDEQTIFENSQRISTEKCKIVNEILKTMLINARIINLEQFQKYFCDVFNRIQDLKDEEKKMELDCLEEIFKLIPNE